MMRCRMCGVVCGADTRPKWRQILFPRYALCPDEEGCFQRWRLNLPDIQERTS